MENTAKPTIASAGEWQQARDALLNVEKQATRALDALDARRRRLPMVKFGSYLFDTPEGPRRWPTCSTAGFSSPSTSS